MLQSIRDRSQGWLTWFLVIIICLSFALFGIHSYFQSGSSEQLVATVNGEKITQQQLQLSYEQLKQQLQSQPNSQFLITPEVEKQLKTEALEQLIYSQLLSKAAYKGHYRVNSQQLNAAIMQIPAFYIDGRFSSERFEAILRQMGYSTDAFINSLQTEMLINQARAGFFSTAFSLPHEIDYLQALLNQARDISYAIVPAASFKPLAEEISATQLHDYYEAHKAEYTVPEQLKISYVELELAKFIAKQKVSEAEIKQYYEDNLANFRVPEQYQLAHILIKVDSSAPQSIRSANNKLSLIQNKLKAHEDFAVLAKTLSEDVVSAKQGGSLGWLHLVDLEPAVGAAIKNLTVGEVSSPIQTQYGFELFKLMAIAPAKTKPLEQVASNIKQRLIQQKAQAQFKQLSEQLANLSFSNPDSLEVVAQQLGLTIQQSEWFGRHGGKTSLTKNTHVVAAAFSKDVLDEANNSELIELAPGHVLVLRVQQFQPAQLKSFESMKSTIKEQLTKQIMQAKANEHSMQIATALNQGKSMAELAKQYKLDWHSVNNLTRYSDSLEQPMIQLAFSLTPAAKSSKQPVAQSRMLANGDSLIMILNKVHPATSSALTEKESKALAAQLAVSKAEFAYQEYISYLEKQAKIKKYKVGSKS